MLEKVCSYLASGTRCTCVRVALGYAPRCRAHAGHGSYSDWCSSPVAASMEGTAGATSEIMGNSLCVGLSGSHGYSSMAFSAVNGGHLVRSDTGPRPHRLWSNSPSTFPQHHLPVLLARSRTSALQPQVLSAVSSQTTLPPHEATTNPLIPTSIDSSGFRPPDPCRLLSPLSEGAGRGGWLRFVG